MASMARPPIGARPAAPAVTGVEGAGGAVPLEAGLEGVAGQGWLAMVAWHSLSPAASDPEGSAISVG